MKFKQKTSQERQIPFDISACIAMMEKMMGEHMDVYNCSEMMSQFSDNDAILDIPEMMSQACCGIGKED